MNDAETVFTDILKLQIKKLNHKYYVDDLNLHTSDIILILESPHADEIKNGFPLAGLTGKAVSKVLIGKEEAIGKLIFEKKDNNALKFGILNISNIPLQKKAILKSDAALYQELYRLFELIRKNPKQRKKYSEDKDKINFIITLLMESLSKKLSKYKNKKIILCGQFVQGLFQNIASPNKFNIINMPHPAHSNWNRQQNRKQINSLKKFIK